MGTLISIEAYLWTAAKRLYLINVHPLPEQTAPFLEQGESWGLEAKHSVTLSFNRSYKISNPERNMTTSGLSSQGVWGVPWHTQILADQLTLFQPGGTDFAHLITTGTSRFLDLPTALI